MKNSVFGYVRTGTGLHKNRNAHFLIVLLVLVVAFSAVACGDEDDEDEAGFNDFGDSPAELSGKSNGKTDPGDKTDDPWKKTGLKFNDEEQTLFAPLTPNGQTVAGVELERYLGKWYEIATFEQAFQRNCTGTTATYGLNEDGTISVTNECYKGSLEGRYDVARAYAKVVDEQTNAKLKVYFFPLFGAPYWVVELDGSQGEDPYEFAVVGSSTKRFLWILSRTPQMTEERLVKILDRLIERGYDIDELSFTLQP